MLTRMSGGTVTQLAGSQGGSARELSTGSRASELSALDKALRPGPARLRRAGTSIATDRFEIMRHVTVNWIDMHLDALKKMKTVRDSGRREGLLIMTTDDLLQSAEA